MTFGKMYLYEVEVTVSFLLLSSVIPLLTSFQFLPLRGISEMTPGQFITFLPLLSGPILFFEQAI